MGKDYYKLGVGDIGYHAPRSCTDIWATILFIIFWTLMMVLAGAGFKHGKFEAMVYGTDYTGHVCGKGDAPAGVSASQWGHMDKLWYPIEFSSTQKLFELHNAKLAGICVSECPSNGDLIDTQYGSSAHQYAVRYNSSGTILSRCVPVFDTFDCTHQKGSALSLCDSEKDGQTKQFNTMLGLGGFLDSGVILLKEKLGVIVGLAVLCIICSFIWLFLLRVLVKPLVAITALALFVFGILCGTLMMHYSRQALDGSSTQKWYLAAAIICWIVTFLYACVVAFLFKDLVAACDIIEEASRVPVEMKRIVIIPVVISLFIFSFAVFQGAAAVAIHTAGDWEPTTVKISGQPKAMETQEYVAKNWRTIGIFYDLFMFLWTMGFLHAICHLVIAFCGVLWYWSMPGEHKEPPSNTVSWSLMTTFRYHLGTLAAGSFIIALIQFLRILMRLFENRLRKIKEASSAARLILCCAECCLSCFERIVALITKDAYVMTAMTGEGLLPAARQAVSLLTGNRAALAVNILGEIILVIGKVLITALITVIAWLIVRGDSVTSNILFIVVMALTAYFISSVFATVFSCCIDAVVMCYCVDKEENNGADKPYYFPEALNRHVDAAHQRHLQKNGGGEGVNEKVGNRGSSYGSTAPLNDQQGYGQI